MCEANLLILGSVRGLGGEFEPEHSCDSDTTVDTRQRVVQRGLNELINSCGEFDPGSGRTLAACLTHASHGGPQGQPANGCVTREQPTEMRGIAGPTAG